MFDFIISLWCFIYLYKANWSDERFVHITSKRLIDRPDNEITVKVYSNCEQVTLYINGTELPAKTSDDKIFIFENVPLKEGFNEVKAIAQYEGEEFLDIAWFNKVDEPNPSYKAPESEGGTVDNWFEIPDLGDVELEELVTTNDVYSTRDSYEVIAQNEDAEAVLQKYLVGMEDHPMFGMAKGMPLNTLAEMAPQQFNEQMLYTLNKELTKIKKA